jgi:hypothetical protein
LFIWFIGVWCKSLVVSGEEGREDMMKIMEGKMRVLKLSEAERLGVRIGGNEAEGADVRDPQDVPKVFSKKQSYAEAVANALGPIWCPMKGIDDTSQTYL